MGFILKLLIESLLNKTSGVTTSMRSLPSALRYFQLACFGDAHEAAQKALFR
jgi:hypothetical protein